MTRRFLFLFFLAALPVSAADIHDLRGPLPPAGLPPFLLTGGALLLAGGVWLLRRRRSARPPTASVPPAAGGDPCASLAAEYRAGLGSAGEIALRLDRVLRERLVAAGIPALQCTSEELLAKALPGTAVREEIGAWLALCDRVKFAGHMPGDAEMDRALALVARLLAALPVEQAA
jgi:hypothetical protein